MENYDRILAAHEVRLFEKDKVTVDVLRAHVRCGHEGRASLISDTVVTPF